MSSRFTIGYSSFNWCWMHSLLVCLAAHCLTLLQSICMIDHPSLLIPRGVACAKIAHQIKLNHHASLYMHLHHVVCFSKGCATKENTWNTALQGLSCSCYMTEWIVNENLVQRWPVWYIISSQMTYRIVLDVIEIRNWACFDERIYVSPLFGDQHWCWFSLREGNKHSEQSNSGMPHLGMSPISCLALS